MKTAVLIGALCVLVCTATAAQAAEKGVLRPRLVTGGMGEVRMAPTADFGELYNGQGVSLGVAGTTIPGDGTNGDRMALGGYASSMVSSVRLFSALTQSTNSTAADVSASMDMSRIGLPGTATLGIGYEWQKGSPVFSLNPAQAGLTGYDAYTASGNDLSLSLSFSHDITPSLSLGGFAIATHGDGDLPQSGLHLGAGFGYRF